MPSTTSFSRRGALEAHLLHRMVQVLEDHLQTRNGLPKSAGVCMFHAADPGGRRLWLLCPFGLPMDVPPILDTRDLASVILLERFQPERSLRPRVEPRSLTIRIGPFFWILKLAKTTLGYVQGTRSNAGDGAVSGCPTNAFFVTPAVGVGKWRFPHSLAHGCDREWDGCRAQQRCRALGNGILKTLRCLKTWRSSRWSSRMVAWVRLFRQR